ncbi:MAG: MSEP-CTERM sorting domain-containing protein [bacterium]
MNTPHEERTDDLKFAWLSWAWILPQALLVALNWRAWILVQGDMSPSQITRAITLGIIELSLLAFGCLALVVQRARGKPIGIGLALAAIASHIAYLWLFLQSIDRLLPATVSLWMLQPSELTFYQFSLMMPVIFLMLVRLARIKLGLSSSVDIGVSLATIVLIPAGAFIFGSLIARLSRAFTWHDSFQYLLIAAMVTGTAFILIATLRLILRLHDLIQRRSWSEWVLPLATGLVAPLAGLALNATIPFPYDFQDVSVYLMTILNAIALLIPFRPGTRWALPGWLARAVFYPFTVYFFLVFLPFLPLSLLAMIAAGAGFLILAPLFLFAIHTRRLIDQGRLLATYYGTRRMGAVFVACLLVLPAAMMLRNEIDRRTLTRAVDAVFNPDYTATRVAVKSAPLRRALDRMDEMKQGIYLPYVSDVYDAMVFHGMVLPDEKADLIRESLLGKAKDTAPKSSLWGNGFLGGRNRNLRQTRGGNITRGVVVASHETQSQATNGMTETEVRFVLENRGGANGEFSERITVPEGVQVTGFWLDVNGTNKPAQLRERKAATWVYEMIRDMTRRDPGLVVYEDGQHIRLRVYPFAPNEKRKCGLRFRFPSMVHPSIRVADTSLPLDLSPAASESVSIAAPLAGGGTALIIPASVITNWPSLRREVVAHLILDHSSCAETNREVIAERARAALAALPPFIGRVRITWANYEQEDFSGEPLSREAAMAAIQRGGTLPCNGGFCPERVIARVLISQQSAVHSPEPAGFASLFLVIPAPGSSPSHSISLAPFTRLAPDLPAYALFSSNGWNRVSFHDATSTTTQPAEFIPSTIVVLRHGAKTIWVSPDKNSLIFAPASDPAGWQLWNPAIGQFEKIEAPAACHDPAYLAGLSLWSRHRALVWTPAAVEAALPDLIKDTRTAGLLIPEAAFIVLETQSQDVMLARTEKQSLSANHALEFDNVKSEKAPAPPALWLILPALWLLWSRRRRQGGRQGQT